MFEEAPLQEELGLLSPLSHKGNSSVSQVNLQVHILMSNVLGSKTPCDLGLLHFSPVNEESLLSPLLSDLCINEHTG